MGPVVWLVNLEDANATPAVHAHLDPQVRLAKRVMMGNRAAGDSLVNPELREAQGLRRNRNPSTAAIAHKVDPELLDPLDLLDHQDQMVNLATLGPQDGQQELDRLDPKDLLEIKDPKGLLDLLDKMDSPDRLEAKERPARRVSEEAQEPQDLLASLDSRPPEAVKDHLDPQGPPASLEAPGNLVPKVHLEPHLRLGTTPNTARVPHMAERPRPKQSFGFPLLHPTSSSPLLHLCSWLFCAFFAVGPIISPKYFEFDFFSSKKK